MRNAFVHAMLQQCHRDDFIFLTGDLGYAALEPLRKEAGDRFINAGVAEQNMISVAAGLCRSGFRPWVYSIAPFLYARAFEQIRNDVALHNLPVRLVGNGGGYGYGAMGATHHALEDYGVLLTLREMKAFVPAFAGDVETMTERLTETAGPAYLRLGRDEQPPDLPVSAYSAWRRLLAGDNGTLLCMGPLAGGLLHALDGMVPSRRPSLWTLGELPIPEDEIPSEFLAELAASNSLAVVEEHTAHGGVGEMIAWRLLRMGCAPGRFRHFFARGYPTGLYGSQAFHRGESGLDPQSILHNLGVVS